MIRIILLGPPGCGKGTQAALLEKSHHLRQISTGGILREAIARTSPIGEEAKHYIDNGHLVPDDIVNRLVAEELRRERPEAFLLDGYPRTLQQATVLEPLLDALELPLTHAILFEVDDEEVVPRISGRRVCLTCHATYHLEVNPPATANRCDKCGADLVHRSDDHEETIRGRLKEFHQNIEELIPFYCERKLLRTVAGEGTIEEVQQRILDALQSQAGARC